MSVPFMERAIYALSASELKLEYRRFVTCSVVSFARIAARLSVRGLSLLLRLLAWPRLRIGVTIGWCRLRYDENRDADDSTILKRYRYLDEMQPKLTDYGRQLGEDARAWCHAVAFEWQLRSRFFRATNVWFYRAIKATKSPRGGRHAVPAAQVRTRYAAVGLIAVIGVASFGGPFLHGKPKPESAVDKQIKTDLAVPVWDASLVKWRDSVRQVSHSTAVVYTKPQSQTNILSETVTTVVNTDKKVATMLTPGQERLLYTFIIIGEGDKHPGHTVCPLDSSTTASLRKQLSDVPGGDAGSLTLCGYRINFIADQLINANGGQQRYATHGAAQFAYDLAYNWVSGTAAHRKAYAADFAALYADWNKSTSPTFNKLRKEK